MKLIVAILILLVGYGAMRLAEDFVARSLNSFRNAERVWAELSSAAEALVKSKVPASVSRLVVALMLSAGCGCYVRGMLIAHYLPRNVLNFGKKDRPSSIAWGRAFGDVNLLTANQQKAFAELMALVVVYDSYRNPLQGYFFRRLLRSVTKPDLDFGTRAEVQLTAFSVVSRKEPRELIPA